MITVTVIKNEGAYKSLDLKGHAGFAKKGKDIVCSAVSMLVINTINSIEQFCEDDFALEQNERLGFIHMDFYEEPSMKAQLLMDSLVLGLENVSLEYGDKYLSLTIKEV